MTPHVAPGSEPDDAPHPAPGVDLMDPGAWPFFCWCVARDGYDFTYIYGTAPEGREVVARQLLGTCLRKGGSRTLAEARARAETLASSLSGVYADFGRVRAMPATAFLADRAPPPRRPRPM